MTNETARATNSSQTMATLSAEHTPGICPGCGKSVCKPPEELKHVKVYCDTCAGVIDAQRAAQARLQRFQTEEARLVSVGVVSGAFKVAGFGRSAADIESQNPEAWKVGRAWKPTSGNLFLHGNPGTGKSFLARCLLRRGLASEMTVAEVTARRLIKNAARFDEGQGHFARMCEVQLLLLDDLDKAKWDANTLPALWELLDARANAHKRTIVTSNMTPQALADTLKRVACDNGSLAEAALNRLRPLEILEMTGESNRK